MDNFVSKESNQKIPNDNPLVDHYLAVINDASHRSRVTLIIMVTASVLALAGLWNSLSWNWLKKRIEVAKTAYDWIWFPDDTSHCEQSGREYPAIDELSSFLNCVKPPFGLKARIPDGIKTDLDEKKISLDEVFRKIPVSQIKQAYKFVLFRKIGHRRELLNRLESLEQLDLENTFIIRVPFFGVAIDINDLALWSGIAFVIILFMFRFSLSREFKNLKYVFSIARTCDVLEVYYELISMYQVFTVPRTRENSGVRFIEKLPICLFALPFVSYIFVVAYDVKSIEAGRSISDFNTYLTIGFSFLLLFFVAWSTWECYKIWIEMNNEWKVQAQNLGFISKS